MELQDFRELVDGTSSEIGPFKGDLESLYTYVGLDPHATVQQLDTVRNALYGRMRQAISSGQREAGQLCRRLKTDLIREHVLRGTSLRPYFGVLDHLQDGLRNGESSAGEIVGDWQVAIRAARDHLEISGWDISGDPANLERVYAREFAVSRAAKFLEEQGYKARLSPDFIALEEKSEFALIAELERLVGQLGGLNVARRIFLEIAPLYDAGLQRYHLGPNVSMTDGGVPQVPWGYLLQLTAKHIDGQRPYVALVPHWPRLIQLATAFAAVVDVQPYIPTAWYTFDAKGILKVLQEQAIYDSLFRFLQLRGTDVLKICRGALSFLDMTAITPGGWSLNDAFEVIEFLLSPPHDVRGPVLVSTMDVGRALPHISRDRTTTILRDVLAHANNGPNASFSHPTDGSNMADFYLKPLIRRPGNAYLILDRSMCSWGYIEALFSALRGHNKHFDDNVGHAIERFVCAEFTNHGVTVASGDYDVDGRHGECDVVVQTPKTLIFMELKKKSLTRRARAGSDVHLLMDLAGSLLDAQAQAGWHDLSIKSQGFLDLERNGSTERISLGGRSVERVAVGMLDFGSFQDRILLKHFFEATLNASFGASDPGLADRFEEINRTLDEIREQYSIAHKDEAEVHFPFFNCWFVSVPQLLVLLDNVSDSSSFREALWDCRHITTGKSDLYFEIANMRRVRSSSQVPS